MAAYYIINVYNKAIGFVGLGNNLGYLLYKLGTFFVGLGPQDLINPSNF